MEQGDHPRQARLTDIDNSSDNNNNIDSFFFHDINPNSSFINPSTTNVVPFHQYPSSSPQLPGIFPLVPSDHRSPYSHNSSLHLDNLESSSSGTGTGNNSIDWINLLSASSSLINSDLPGMFLSSPLNGSLASRDLCGADNSNMNNGGMVFKSGGSGGGGGIKGKGGGRGKKVVPSRVAFHTKSSEDILDDGYKWRKYGQKSVKNSLHPRSYYRCTHHTCNVKKQIQRHSKDNSVVVTTYEGHHNHPCEKLMETLGPLLKQLQFLSRF